MAGMAKKPRWLAGTKATVRWRISLLKGTPAKFLGYIEAPDEKAAIEAAAKEYKIADVLGDRLVARREPLASPFAVYARTTST
jgi:hypothetical protein